MFQTIKSWTRTMAIQTSPRMLFYRSPWGKALLLAAAKLYRESDRWRERVDVLGMDYADRAFYSSPFEIRWFKRLALKDRKLMARVIFTPFSIERMI